MKLRKLAGLSLASVTSVFLLCGADGGCNFFTDQPSSVNYSKQISTVNESTVGGQIVNRTPRPSTPIAGLFVQDDNGATGPNPTAFGSATGVTPYSLYTDGQGNYNTPQERLNATWDLKHNWIGGCNVGTTNLSQLPDGQYYAEIGELTLGLTPYYIACNGILNHYVTSPVFANDAALPDSFTDVASLPLTTTYGYPTLNVYDKMGSIAAQLTASSIASDGVTATFPYPTNLAAGMYGTAILNATSTGSQSYAGGGDYFSLGHTDSSFSQPFAVALGNSYDSWSSCTTSDPYNDRTYAGQTYCSGNSSTTNLKIVSLYGQGGININGSFTATGSQPTVTMTYGSIDNSTGYDNPGEFYSDDSGGTAGVLVVNTGSNSVSLVALQNNIPGGTLAVGSHPVAAAIDPTASYAYIANYDDGTMTRIDLNSATVTNTVAVGPSPDAVGVDAQGNVWVGGPGYIRSLNPTTLSSTSNTPVQGSVVSLGVSDGKGELVVSVASDGSGNPPASFANSQVSIELLSMSAALANGNGSNPPALTQITQPESAQNYFTSGQQLQLVYAGQISTGILASATYGGGITATATAAGFSVLNLDNNQVILAGTTPSPVRSITFDGYNSVAYMTVPEANQVISVPVPLAPY